MTLSCQYKNIIKTLSLTWVFLLLLTGCKDDFSIYNDEVPRQDNLPVDLSFNIAGSQTRGPSYFKTEFEPDEVVHVEGIFHISDGSTIVKYAAMKYDGEKWRQDRGASDDAPAFTWPNNAVDADFKAYYIYGSTGLMLPVDDPDDEKIPVTTLSEIVGTSSTKKDTDPLQASATKIRYGHTIPLEFIHACSYLTVEELPGGVSGVFWFTRQDNDGKAPKDFKNAFRCYLNSENRLIFEFIQKPDPAYDGKVYIEGTSVSSYIGQVEKTAASFFLAPGKYMDFVVGYPGSNTMVNFISYTKQINDTLPNPDTDSSNGSESDSDDNGEETDPDDNDIESSDPKAPLNPNNLLEANGVYTFNVSKSKGVVIENGIPPLEWDESEDPIYDVDAEQFLWAICNHEEYYVDNVQIIKSDGTYSQLLHNVNIQWKKYTIFPPSEHNEYTWFEPILSQGDTFDGGLHYIWNLGSPLFITNNGIIKNLGLANAQITVVTMDNYIPEIKEEDPSDPDNNDNGGESTIIPSPKVYDLSQQGALCGLLGSGTIENIRIKTHKPEKDPDNRYNPVFEINAEVWGEDSQESHSIGGLVGFNDNGYINDITIFCDININVTNHKGMESHVPRTYIGGIIGQNAQEIHNIGVNSGTEKITITNDCYYSTASFSIGGGIGFFSSGLVNNLYLPNIFIDSRNSRGMTAYIGGLVGRLPSATDAGTLRDCQVGGTIYAGKSEATSEGSGSVYTGGLSGDVYESYTLENNFTSVNVYGPYSQGEYDNYVADGTVTYGTGGMFGIINKNPGQTPENIKKNVAIGKIVQGPQINIGNFAGKAPDGETWEDNFAPQGNIITSHTLENNAPMPNIGYNPDSTQP